MADAQTPLEVGLDITRANVSAWLSQRIDGAVAELTDHGGGIITAEIRIPGPA